LLLDTLYDLVVDRGVAAVTVHDVVETADVAVGTFYNHFESRESAIDELVTEAMAEARTQVTTVVEEVGDAAVVLGQTAFGLLERTEAQPRWAMFMARIADSAHWPIGTQYEGIAHLISAGQDQGSLRSEIPAEERAVLYSALIRATFAINSTGREPLNTGMVIVSCLQVAGANRATIDRVLESLGINA
jgi:AcrR family transcriptional regulator